MKLKDYIIVSSLFVVFGILFIWITFFSGQEGHIAKVYQGNQVVIEVDFENETYKTFTQENAPEYPKETTPVAGEGGDLAFIILGEYMIDGERTEVYIEIDWDTKSIRIERDQTPKQIGVGRDWYNGQGLPVISLPNQVFITFEKTSEDEVDGAV